MQPLEGLRVLDLADEKGELCGRLLADLGAEVLRIEPPVGAISRRLGPFAEDKETSLYFALRNAGKTGITLDLETPEGKNRFEEIATDADIVIESFSPGELARHGLGPDTLLERYPALIVVSISDFGQTGPYRDYLGTDMIGFAMGGLMHRAGRFEKPPVVAPGALAYDTAGVTAAYATLLAFYKRLQTGRGQHIDVSVMESVANLSDWALPNYSVSPGVSPRAGTGMYTLYQCADGFIRMIILVKHHWRSLLDWIGSPEALSDPSFDEFLNRLMKMDVIVPEIEAFFRDKKKVEVACEAQRRGIPATPLLTPGEVLDNEHTRERETFRSIEVGEATQALLPAGFLHVDGTRAGPQGRPPRVGENTASFSSGVESARRTLLAENRQVGDRGDGQPLHGLRVIDFGVGAVGVEVGRLLAEYGADVIKIETHLAPDFIRIIMGSFMNPPFASSSRSKRSFGVNVKSPEGLEIVMGLVRKADVLIENNGAGVMDRLGLGAAALHEANPGIISFSSQMVGSSGPWKEWIGYGPNTHPVSGLQYLWNYPEDADSPAGSTNVYPDHLVGRLGAFAVMAGLVQRWRTGVGLHADAAQFETAIGFLGDLLAGEGLVPGSIVPQGNASERGAPWGCYPCAGEDEWCVINVRSDSEWEGLRRALGDPEWGRSVLYANGEGRRRARDVLDREVAQWTASRSAYEVMHGLQAEKVPAGIVAHAGHHIEDPHLQARGFLRPVEQPGLGSMVLEGPAFHGSDLPESIIGPAPRLGEHTREIASRDLGLSVEEIESLVAAGVLEDPPEEAA